MGAVRIKVLAQHKYVCTAMQISQLIYRFSAGQLHILIHINETLENLGFWFDTLLPSFQEWDCVLNADFAWATCHITFCREVYKSNGNWS